MAERLVLADTPGINAAYLVSRLNSRSNEIITVGELDDMGTIYNGRGVGRLAVALALAMAVQANSIAEAVQHKQMGDAMLFGMRNHYRTHHGASSRPSGAAWHKRASKKRRNIAKRSGKR